MAHTYTLDEIRVRLMSDESKAAKVAFLTDECGYTKREAENMYFITLAYKERNPHAFKSLSFTYGVEMECSHLDTRRFSELCSAKNVLTRGSAHEYNHTDSQTHYKFVSDSSLSGSYGDTPCELVSPILENLDSLKVVCENLAESGAKVNKTCGLHVHMGADKFSDEEWYRIVCNYGRIEKAIDSFMAESRRGEGARWCAGVKHIEARMGADHSRRSLVNAMNANRYHKVNVMAYDRHRTIEFRQHQGTTNFTKIENWIKFLTALVSYSIKNTALIPETDRIEEIPFMDDALKSYYISRREELARA